MLPISVAGAAPNLTAFGKGLLEDQHLEYTDHRHHAGLLHDPQPAGGRRGTVHRFRPGQRCEECGVIGQTAAENLFGPGVDPIGRSCAFRDAPFTIVGVLEPKGQNAMGVDQDDGLFIPLSAFQTRMQRGLGTFVPGRIAVSAVSPEAIPRVRQEISELLRERYRLAPDEEDDSPPAAWRR